MLKPMTDEQRKLAEENHDLVYTFLRENNLPINQYYDVVIFGYLCAVQEYCEEPDLRRYKLTTIAWKLMMHELSNHQKYLSSKKKSYTTVSFDDFKYKDSALRWKDVLLDEDDILEQLQTDLILHELAAKLPETEMRLIRRKLYGEKMHDIAKAERMTFHDITLLLRGVHDIVVKVILG